MRKLIIWLILISLLSGLSSAGTISISTSVSTQVVDSTIYGTIDVKNLGDSVAYDVLPQLHLLDNVTKLPMESTLGPGDSRTWKFEHSGNMSNPGTYPLVLEVFYKDSNKYPFSAITISTFHHRTATIPSIELSVGSLEISKSGFLPVQITSNTSIKEVQLIPVLSVNLIGEYAESIIDINGSVEESFEIKRGSALSGSRYNAFFVAEYDDAGNHYTKVASGTVSVIDKKHLWTNKYFGILLILVLIIWILISQSRPSNEKRRELAVDIASLLIIFVFILTIIKPSLIFLDTTITGGDTGSHVVIAHFLRYNLLPAGHLVGWYPGWMAGLPLLQFYFIPPYVAVALLSFIMPFNIAFKLITVFGILLFPFAIYLLMRLLKFRFPVPIIASAMGLYLLFDESFSRWGGNIKSTFAGQFPHMISFALLIIGIGLLFRVYFERKYLILAVITLTFMFTTHIYTTIIFLLSCTYFAFLALFRKRFTGIAVTGFIVGLAGLLAGYWIVPMFFKLSWSSAPSDILYGFPMFKEVFTPFYLTIMPLAFLGIFRFRMKSATWFFVYSYIVVLAMTVLSKYTTFLYIRFISYLYLLILILSSMGIYFIIEKLKAKHLIALLIVISSVFYISQTTSDISSWARWNYEGLEKKTSYPLLGKVLDKVRQADVDGRVNFEYSNYNYFGTPRVFETSPIFTGKPVMEALLVESSLTFPFHYYIQKEITQEAWWPTFKLKIPEVNLSQAADDMALYNIKYFISSSTVAQEQADHSEKYSKEGQIEQFGFYRLNEVSDWVKPLENEPVLVITQDFKPFTYKWISSENKDVFLAFSNQITEKDLKDFRLIFINKSLSKKEKRLISGRQSYTDLDKAIAESTRKESGCRVSTDLQDNILDFQTSCPNLPHLIKISFFPNWKSKNREIIYPATPSLMLIFPENGNNHIYYGVHWSDRLGQAFTAAGMILLILLISLKRPGYKKKMKQFQHRIMKGQICRKIIRNYRKVISQWKLMMVILGILLILWLIIILVLGTVQDRKQCDILCVDKGYGSGQGSEKIQELDTFDMGYNNKRDNRNHNLTCNLAFCDESRRDFVYVHSGNITFDMAFAPGKENILILGVTGKTRCRYNEVYVGKDLVGIISSDLSVSTDYTIPVSSEYVSSDRMRVTISNKEEDGCFGFDIYEVRTAYNSCMCK